MLIPGTVGAAPIQNIGAYGVEIREFVHAVEAFEWRTGRSVRMTNAQCQFDYRDSVFKRDPSRYIVTPLGPQPVRGKREPVDVMAIAASADVRRINTTNGTAAAKPRV